MTSINFEQSRRFMIEQQIRPWNVLDAQVLARLSSVRRELFVPLAHQALAFVDMELPLGNAGGSAAEAGQCMLAPRVEARLLQDLALKASDRVLEIGTGSAYMAALLGSLSSHVTSLEIDPALVHQARRNLAAAGTSNVDVLQADGSEIAQIRGEFDVIVLSGSVAEVPHALLAKLTTGGRLAAIVGELPMMRVNIVTRQSNAVFDTLQPWDTVAPRLLGFSERPRFKF
jgi:protein-L-isoaspartate(D-aspartate) O-methyltransferase